jgi:glycosyltransferase involved in cell wall biosynthesis
MRVLVLHSRYTSGPASGENRAVEDEIRLLAEAGHDVRAWLPSPAGATGPRLAGLAAGTVWSRAAASELRLLIGEHRPDVVHCHNLFPMLSPSVLASAGDVPVVVTLHSYRMMCLSAVLVRDGRVCEDCVGRTPWPGVVHGCYRGSRGASAALAGSLALHRRLRTFDRVRLFLAVSPFVARKHVQAGLDPSRIRVKPNFSWPAPVRRGPGRHFLFLGRLSPEKGVNVLLDAWRALGERRPAPRLVIAGDGPAGPGLRAAAPPGVEFVGTVRPQEVPALVGEARALLLPSVCYEGEPRSVLEAFAAGVPVLASRTGGLPALVDEDACGLLAPPGDVPAWTAAVERLCDDETAERLGRGAYRRWGRRHSPGQGLRALTGAYDEAIEAKAKRGVFA